MSVLPEWRNLVCGVVIVLVPASLPAQESGRAMLHSEGETRLNENLAPNSSAIFLHDVVQTLHEHGAKIDAEGSTVTVQPDTIVQFEGDELVLDHGTLQLNTSRQLRVRVNCMTIVPLIQEWTHYDVINVDGKTTVVAYENDVKIHSRGTVVRASKPGGAADVTVHQGEQVTRDERCGAPARPAEIVNAKAAILNHPIPIGAGAAVVGVLTCLGLCHHDDPLSPSKP